MRTFNFTDLNQARTSIKLNSLIARESLVFSQGFKLADGDAEIDVVEFEGHSGCYVVDNADAQYSELSLTDTIDLLKLNTDDLTLSQF